MNGTEVALAVLEGRWKLQLIRELLQGVRRFSELHRTLNGITHKVLTQKLRELERDGIVRREVHAVIPARVDYSLTPSGHALRTVLDAMHDWGTRHLHERG